MPRMYMALAQEDRHPITDIIRQTPDIPDNCQWAIFLRNHDELTLEMVTDRERDYLWETYATDRRMRINLGIRRRLAPLLDNDRRKIELMNALLFSMPGTPVIYYGDEIGMGDNFYLGDRDGVRTPMQWSPDRNGGFSRADPQRLYLPPIMDPIYGYEAVNVESQVTDRSSLLNWMIRLLAVRKQRPAFGRGTMTSSIRATARSWPTCANTKTTRCWRCSTWPAPPRPSSSTWRRSRAGCRSSCSAARRSRPSAICPTCSPCRPTAFTGLSWQRRRKCRSGMSLCPNPCPNSPPSWYAKAGPTC
jgi:hypothetical protein